MILQGKNWGYSMELVIGDLVVDAGRYDKDYYYVFKVMACEGDLVRVKGVYNIVDSKLVNIDISDTLCNRRNFTHAPLEYYLAYLKLKGE